VAASLDFEPKYWQGGLVAGALQHCDVYEYTGLPFGVGLGFLDCFFIFSPLCDGFENRSQQHEFFVGESITFGSITTSAAYNAVQKRISTVIVFSIQI
jgi:hypothetical protein